jgi:EpsI family protein
LGRKKTAQLIVLIVVLLITGLLAYKTFIPAELPDVVKSRDLQTVFGPVKGYKIIYRSPLEKEIYKFLELDDYTSVGYEKDGASVSLYIGYYYSLDKVSSAHSPLVCFPGQGWGIDTPSMHSLKVGDNTINYAEIVATLGGRHELVMYWYQAYDTTATDVYRNKINAMINKLTKNQQEHAFVRVSVPFGGTDKETARQTGIEFIRAFYPVFLGYVNQDSSI